MSRDMRIVIADLPDREHLVADIWIEGEQFAEISRLTDDRTLTIEIYHNPQAKAWIINFEDIMEYLKRAQVELVGGEANEP